MVFIHSWKKFYIFHCISIFLSSLILHKGSLKSKGKNMFWLTWRSLYNDRMYILVDLCLWPHLSPWWNYRWRSVAHLMCELRRNCHGKKNDTSKLANDVTASVRASLSFLKPSVCSVQNLHIPVTEQVILVLGQFESKLFCLWPLSGNDVWSAKQHGGRLSAVFLFPYSSSFSCSSLSHTPNILFFYKKVWMFVFRPVW